MEMKHYLKSTADFFLRNLIKAVWLSFVFSAGVVAAAPVNGSLRVEVVTAYNLVVDSNAGTPSSYAPQAAYIGATFYNDGAVPLTDLIARIGNYNGGTGATPGIYPARLDDNGLVGPLTVGGTNGMFALKHEGGSAGLADATRYLPTIPAGESVTVYWLVGYDQLDVNGVPLWGKSVKPFDDLWLEYDIWATAKEGASTRNVDVTRTFTMRNEISASANKILPNGANKVPDYYKELFDQYVPAWTNAYYDGSVGTEITTEGIWYDLGNIGAGFDNNGDLVPDKNAWMQPVGNPEIFDSGAFRLVGTYAYVIVKLKSGGVKVLEGQDQLYFENIPENNGAVGFVQYFFMPLQPNARAMTSPYQEVASGNDNEKFNADYGIALGDEMVSGPSHVTMGKTASVSQLQPAGTIQYTVGYTNTGSVAVGNPAAGVPLVIQDSIPAGTTYISGSATANNVLPAGVTSYTVLYSADGGMSWSTSEPSNASTVTHLQWWLSNKLAPAAHGIVRFSVSVPFPFVPANPLITNTAGLSFGSTLPFLYASATTLVLGNNSIGDLVWRDNGIGTGGYFANGIQDGTEAGLANITVRLYYDANGNGAVDTGESLLRTTSSAANGAYSFANLPDGNYVVMVDTTDPDLPVGDGITTRGLFAVALDPTHATTSPVNNTTSDFGFAPVLGMQKTLPGNANLLEGQTVTYSIGVTNRLAGDGTGVNKPTTYRLWAKTGTTGSSNKAFTNPANAYHAVEPDKQYATPPMAAADEWLDLTSMSIGPQLGSITSVKVILPVRVSGIFDSTDTFAISVRDNGTAITGTTLATNCTLLASGTYEIKLNITAARTWSWASFASTNKLSVYLLANGKPTEPGIVEVDAAAFEITSSATSGGSSPAATLNPVPLDDTFPTNRLKFVSSVPPVNTLTTSGTPPNVLGKLHWNNVGPLYPGGFTNVTVTFKVLQPPYNATSSITNTAIINAARFVNGNPVNTVTSKVVRTVQPTGTIGDTVWRDLDSNGVQSGTNETGISGVTVRLYTNSTVLVATAVTDANGKYLFEGLTANTTYTVTVVTTTLPGGVGTCTKDKDATPNSTTTFPLNPAGANGTDTVLDADFGYNNLQSIIRGTIWNDLNRDGASTPGSGEDLLSGITVQLRNSGGTVVATTTTGAGGTYQFVGAYSGNYSVTPVTATGPLAGWTRSYDTNGIGTPDSVAFSMVLGGVGIADFSYYRTGTLSVGDQLFYDWNGNGIQESSDLGIANITVYLYQDENKNGIVDAGVDALIATTVTGTNGLYTFANRPAATNLLIIVDQADPDFPALFTVTKDPQGAKDGRSTITFTATRTDQDFGYQPYGFNSIGDTVWFDANGDGTQLGVTETGIAGATVRLYVDYNHNGVWTLVSTQVTDANGKYLFASLPDFNYRVTVDSTGAGIPDDAFGNDWSPTTATLFNIAASGGNAYLNADFGFAPLGAIGDTIYWDNNGNADQDWTEPGVSGVTVNLYYDNDGDKVLSAGDTLAATKVTDANGNYLFTGLKAGNYVVDVVDASGPLADATLTGDPENDGEPCPIPAISGPTCDGQAGVKILPGTFFMGADFGYQPPGVIGDLVWVDLNTNGVFDAGEQGIPYVPVVLYSGTGTTVPVATNYTDGDGYYSFGNLADGIYTVAVLTNNVNNPFPPNLTASYDVDGTPDNTANTIVISGGHITTIGGNSVTNADLTIDFGYRYATGSNSLSGTVGLDVDPYDGLMNSTNASGPGPGEYAFTGVAVNLLLWNDDGDNLVEPGEYTTIATTQTDVKGDYRFNNLPAGDGNDRYIVSISAPGSELKLTTDVNDTAATILVNTTNLLGYTTSAYQVVPIVPVRENIDFAFKNASTVLRDYGDLPVSYSTTIAEQPVGPSHTIITNTPLYLGTGVSAEANGQPSPAATADTYENGVQVAGLQWTEGAAGGSVTVNVGAGAGWLVGWIDFNQDGTFTNANEQVFALAVDHAVNGGVYNLSFNIPSNTFSSVDATYLNARFRLYATKPLAATFFGDAVGGDVEDYQFVRGIAGNYVWEDINGNGVQDGGEPGVSNVVVNLYQSDGTTLVESTITAADGSYLFKGLQPADYVIKVVQPAGTMFTTTNAGANIAVDSNADAAGSLGTVSLLSDPVRDDVDAGVYVPAQLYGYLFIDENANLLRNSGDTAITNALVTLTVNGISVATTNTDALGYYFFGEIPVGAATILVSRVNTTLIAVPATLDPTRNRAVSNTVATAMVVYPVVSGYGVLSPELSEPLNFGFDQHPLSTAIDLKVYTTADGRVMIELSTVNENGNNDIEIYAMLNGAWVLVANVPSEEIVGFGSNSYTVEAFGLTPGESYLFRIIDESGHIFETGTPVTVALSPILVEAVTLTPEMITVAFNTEYGNFYQVMVCDNLGAPWVVEYVQYPTAKGFSALNNEPFMAGPGERTEVRIPRNNRASAFFKIIKVQ